MEVIAILAGKGGVGKTTTAVALAAALHDRRGAHKLAVDLLDVDPQGGATWACGIDPNDLEPGAGIVAALEGRSLDAARTQSAEGFGVFAASPAIARFESRVVAALKRFRNLAVDVLIIDTPPGVGVYSQAAAALADRIVVPCNPEPASVHTLRHVFALLDAIQARGKLAGVVLTETPPRTLLAVAQRDEVRALAPLLGEIPRSIAVAESVNAGQSVIGYAPKSAAAVAYRDLAAALFPH